MKRRLVPLMMLLALWMGAPAANADRNPEDCFPVCPTGPESLPKGATSPSRDEGPPKTPNGPKTQDTPACTTTPDWIKGAEDINAKIKPVKEWAGYLRSPQGLALKLVNDHVFRIPEWVGFALDPVGTVKHKAIDAVRQRATDAVVPGRNCEPRPEGGADRSIDAA